MMLALYARMISERPISIPGRPLSRPPAPRPAGGRSVSEPGLLVPAQRWSIALVLVFLLWITVFFGPDFWFAANGISMGRKVANYLYVLLAGLVVMRAPAPSKATWSLPFLCFLLGASFSIPFAENTGIARGGVFKILALYWVLTVGSLVFIRRLDKAALLNRLFLLQFPWWAGQALFADATFGRTAWHPIRWHPDLSNTDAFGPLMVIGMAFSFYYAVAARRAPARVLAFVVTALCVVGIVAAYTRGATLAAGLIVLYVWLRSPHTGKTTRGLLLATAVFLIATNLIYPNGQFWARLGTITSEGTSAGTGADRWALWHIGWRVFLMRPLVGVGADNFGIFAYSHIPTAELPGSYHLNEWFIYGRGLHNIYVQLLAEFGLVGAACFGWMLVDFWQRNRDLRTQPFRLAWQRLGPAGIDLRTLSLAFEGGMVAFLLTGCFYNEIYEPWLYSLLALNGVLHLTLKRSLA
ncbi:MAG: O-antigen ligase family protein [Chloroflexi bacterium]|nr:MAG: O-antigen ligase family protein [Chloroflexota bacterium]